MSREVWAYRDWVIKAFNDDMPYDRFVIEQLAGDLLPNATQDQIVATGFIRMSMLNEEGGIDPEQFRMDAMFDRMDAVGKAFLGLSIACCQCHDHKFDPLTQEEYYQLFAFLNNDYEAERVVYTPAERMTINRHPRSGSGRSRSSSRRSDAGLGEAAGGVGARSVPRRSRSGRRSRSRTRATTRSATFHRRTARSSRRATPRRSSAR